MMNKTFDLVCLYTSTELVCIIDFLSIFVKFHKKYRITRIHVSHSFYFNLLIFCYGLVSFAFFN